MTPPVNTTGCIAGLYIAVYSQLAGRPLQSDDCLDVLGVHMVSIGFMNYSWDQLLS